jgi:hypothetical protein
MQTLPYSPTVGALTWNQDAGYQELARRSVFPALESLASGRHDAEALLSVAFGPLAHSVLDCCLGVGSAGLFRFLRQLIHSTHPDTITRFVEVGTAWATLDTLAPGQTAAAFDLRPGGGPECDLLPYVPLVDTDSKVPDFHLELLPLVVQILQGWGAILLVIHPVSADNVNAHSFGIQAQALWSAMLQPNTASRRSL